MKKFFSKFFSRNKKSTSIVSFEVLDSIYAYLFTESKQLSFKMKGIRDSVSVTLYSFPDSFNHEGGKKEIANSGFKNPYEVLNELYKKLAIGGLSDEEISKELSYDYIHIQFYSDPIPEMQKDQKAILQNFIVFFCCTHSVEANDFKVLYTNSYFPNYVKGLLESAVIDVKMPKNEGEQIGVRDFEMVLQGICEYLEIEIPTIVIRPSSHSLLPDAVSLMHFQEFVELLSRGSLNEESVEEQAKLLFNKVVDEEDEDEDYDVEFDFFEHINSWNSDWKFDPEDVEYFLSEMIGEEFSFDYPEETYSHDLFPYIQEALAKQDLELMSYDTKGDNYLFFLVNKKDVDRILELAEITEIGIDQLN